MNETIAAISTRPVRARLRCCGNAYGLPEWIRVSIGTAEQNARFLDELKALPEWQNGAAKQSPFSCSPTGLHRVCCPHDRTSPAR